MSIHTHYAYICSSISIFIPTQLVFICIIRTIFANHHELLQDHLGLSHSIHISCINFDFYVYNNSFAKTNFGCYTYNTSFTHILHKFWVLYMQHFVCVDKFWFFCIQQFVCTYPASSLILIHTTIRCVCNNDAWYVYMCILCWFVYIHQFVRLKRFVRTNFSNQRGQYHWLRLRVQKCGLWDLNRTVHRTCQWLDKHIGAYLCTCMHICMCVYMHKCIYVYVYIYTHAQVCIYTYIYTHIRLWVEKNSSPHMSTIGQIYRCIFMHVYAYTYVCISA